VQGTAAGLREKKVDGGEEELEEVVGGGYTTGRERSKGMSYSLLK
jgi:hypothetical protein